MTDRNLIGGLALTFLMDQLFHRETLFEGALLEPAAGQMQHRI